MVVEAQVGLPTVFGLQVGIAYLIAERTLMHAVAAQFTHVGSTEASGHIKADVHVFCGMEHRPHAARQSGIVAIMAYVAVVKAQAAAHGPSVHISLRRGIAANVKQTVGGYERLFGQVL